MSEPARGKLKDFDIPTSVKMSLLWASVMFLYLYNDYFSMYTPGTIGDMARGNLGPAGQASEGVLVGVSVLLAVPSMMIFLSSGLKPVASRWLNIVLGTAYTAVETLTLFGAPLFYKIVVIAEMILTLLIVLYAARWPRTTPAG